MKTLTSLMVLAAFAAPAAYAGNIEPAPVEPTIAPAPAPAFTGRDWTGGYAGAQLGYGDLNTSGAADLDGDGLIGGLHAGYDFDLGDWVLGGAIDYDASDIELSNNAGDLNEVLRVKFRGGYDLGDTLIYGTTGLAWADADVGGSSFDDQGYFVGFGAERFVTDNVTIGGELLYHEFDDFDDTDVDIEATTIQARVSWRF